MTRRELLLSPAALTLSAATTRPNVVVFLADDLGWKDTGYQGSDGQTPHIDRLCREGVRLDRMHAFPLCSPTRSGLMTGRNPIRLGLGYTVVRPWSTYGLPIAETTMANVFHDAGYQTAAIGKWHLGHANKKHHPCARGFDYFYGHMNGAIDYFTHERDGGLDWQRNGASVREEGYSTDLLAADAERWLNARDRQRPFFLYVPWNAPHSPMQPREDLLAKYAAIKDKRRQTYVAMVDALDSGIGRIMAAIEKQGAARDTIAVFLSDNGGPRQSGADNGPLRAGKQNVYEGGIRVPAVVHWPAQLKPGATSNQLMTVWDMLPTLSAACGITPKTAKALDGMNCWPQIAQGAAAKTRENLLFCVRPERGPMQHAVRDGAWKLVRIGHPPDKVTESLFHIDDDPNEKNDLIAANAETASRLRTLMDEWIRQAPPGEANFTLQPHPGFVFPKDWAKVAVE